MPLADLLQWIDMTRKTGTITATCQGTKKRSMSKAGKLFMSHQTKKENGSVNLF